MARRGFDRFLADVHHESGGAVFLRDGAGARRLDRLRAGVVDEAAGCEFDALGSTARLKRHACRALYEAEGRRRDGSLMQASAAFLTMKIIEYRLNGGGTVLRPVGAARAAFGMHVSALFHDHPD